MKRILLAALAACLCSTCGMCQAAGDVAPVWKGNIEGRRKAIADAARPGKVSEKTIQAIIDAMASTADEVEPDATGGGIPGMQDPGGEMRKAMGGRPVLLGASCDALLKIGAPAFRQVLRGLDHQNRWVRMGSAWVLGRMANKDAVIPLSALLDKKTEDYNVRSEAASSLKLFGDPRSAPYADRALQSVPMKAGGFLQMMTLLAQTDEGLASKWVLELGTATQPGELQGVAAQVAGMLKDQATGDLLLTLLKVQDSSVRLEAARSAGTRMHKPAEPILIPLATTASENGGVRAQSAWALARLGNPAGKQVLQQLMTDGPDFAKSQAKESLEALQAGKETNLQKWEVSMTKFEPSFVDFGGGLYVRIE
jgi:hypothetical protein